ncbi:MAG: hypothetical protein JKY54_04290 [Flavobacteriales bacterium]|nr:hypothetical protein [Flavobacteriales bacterium]
MKILQPNTVSTINFKVIPRSQPVTVVAIFRDESTKVPTNYNVTPTYSNGFMTLSDVFLVDEGVFYQLTIKDGTDIIYRGRIFCTAQTDFAKYTVASGVYKEIAAENNTYKY